MRRVLGAVVLVCLLTPLLAACGEDSPEEVRADYCEQVTDSQRELTEILAEDAPDTLLRALPVFRRLAEQAPRDVEDDWALVTDALEGLDEALDEAGADAATYDADKPPADVTEEQQEAIARAADELATPEVAAAYEGVKQHAKDVCKTPLFQ